MSVLISAAIDSGEPGKGSDAWRARNCFVSASLLIWLNQPASSATIAGGVPPGTTTPHHGVTSISPRPSSCSVGTSGRLLFRLAEVTARMPTRVGCLYAAHDRSTDMKSKDPPRRCGEE